MADKADVILKVLLTLDYMKLCVNHENPVGDGVSVDIAVMPDFVVDIDGAVIAKLNQPEKIVQYELLSPAEVGSRAGRIVTILSHLRDLDDEAFQIHYIAKTGMTGKAVLEDRLNVNLRKNYFQPLRLPLLVPCKQTRYTALGRKSQDDIYAERQVYNHNEQTLMSPNDLINHFYEPLKKITNCRAIYFGTDSLNQFNELIATVLLGESESENRKIQVDDEEDDQSNEDITEQRHVFLDLSAIHYKGTDKVSIKDVLNSSTLVKTLDKFSKLAIHPGNITNHTYLTFILKTESKSPDLSDVSRKLYMREGKDTLLIYNNEKLYYKDKMGGINSICIPWDMNRPDGREAFIAGLILYRAVGAAWHCIPHLKNLKSDPSYESEFTKELFPDPYKDHGGIDCWPIGEGLDFGESLAKLWEEPAVIARNRRTLLMCNVEEDEKEKWQLENKDPLSNLATAEVKDWFIGVSLFAEDCINQKGKIEVRRDFAKTIYGLAKNSKLAENPERWKRLKIDSEVLKVACFDCIRVQFVLQTLRRMCMSQFSREFDLSEDGKAYLADLDGALLQSSELRGLCLRKAFLSILLEHPEYNKNQVKFPLLPSNLSIEMSVSEFLNRCAYLYTSVVYKNWEYWEKILSDYPYYGYGNLPKDFRQVWNHPLSYPVFIWALNKLFVRKDLSKIAPVEILVEAIRSNKLSWKKEDKKTALNLPGDFSKPHNYIASILPGYSGFFSREEIINEESEELISTEIKLPYIREIHREIATLEARFKRIFETASKNYWDVKYQPFRQTKELLRTLRDVYGVQLYIATEGHHDTQIQKLRVLGLDEFFSEARTLSTGAAANPYEDLHRIKEEIMLYRQRKASLKDIPKFCDLKNHQDANFKDNLSIMLRDQDEKLKLELEYLEAYKKQWEAFKSKGYRAIYSLIVASIMVEPDSPLLVLTNLRHLELNLVELESSHGDMRAMHFAMVGDRESKDIRPILECWGVDLSEPKITTIRLLTYDHRDEALYWDKNSWDEKRPIARYVAWAPIHILLLLSKRESWCKKLGYNYLPPSLIPGRLAELSGNIDDVIEYNEEKKYHLIYPAMVWGEEMMRERKYTGAAFSLMNYLALKCTINDSDIGSIPFANGVEKRLKKDRENRNWKSYRFLFKVTKELWTMVENRARYSEDCRVEDLKKVAEIIRDCICHEINKRFGEMPGADELEAKAVDILDQISGHSREKKAYCSPPEEGKCNRAFIVDAAEQRKLTSIIQHWKNNWELRNG